MDKEPKKPTDKKITVAVCGGVLLLAVTLVLGAVLAPGITARSELGRIRRVIGTDASGNGSVSVSEIVVVNTRLTGYETDGDGEIHLTGDDARAYADWLLTLIDGAKYERRTDAVGGNWGKRVRVTLSDGSSEVIYLIVDGNGDGETVSSFYFVRGLTQFHFSPDK